MKYFIANWKANKEFSEVKNWFDKFLSLYQPSENIVIISPPFLYLIYLKELIARAKPRNIFLAAQDISCFDGGSYTGEITGSLLKGLVDFVIVGHSERRKNFNETNEIIKKKISLALRYQIKPILCISNEKELIDENCLELIAYEPISAIGTGNNLDLESVLLFKKRLEIRNNKIKFLYGGSINEKNIESYHNNQINGFLIGTASLNPLSFYQIIKKG